MILFKKSPWILAGLLVILILAVFVASLNTGVIRLSPMNTFNALLGKGSSENELILFDFRMPRMVLSMCVGAGLAIAGAIFQSITRNDLAEPGLIGINAGAGVAVVLFIFLTGGVLEEVSGLSVFMLPLLAFLGAILTAGLIYLFAWKNGVTPLRLILVGVAMQAILSAVLIVLQLSMEDRDFNKALVWLMGSIYSANWGYVWSVLPWLLILIPFAIYKSRYLNILHVGDAAAMGLGINVERERKKLLIVAAALTGASVSAGGGIAFAGLVAPHVARRLVGPKHERFLPISALIGALLLLFADMIARTILMPSELPVGIVVSCIGAPYFLYLLMKSK
ncbi:FecCD family ABC transporter permease [Domibacillus epiphyticus]|uniref:Iron ABC transporter permease n=1 Tax=Domibacillus epiphyticus TaxID=1714355 RepID=A0A1V2A5P8_9BACI|nr:iron ABC transporter permease [Domibacillus epiphyticus]OMP66250.1 iron ABC transporter permease [Domibacillus epiphyticus]